jgi:hypothetical protein
MKVFSNKQLILLIFLLLSIIITLKCKTNEGLENASNDTLNKEIVLQPGFDLTSKNGKYRLDFDLDGTLRVTQLAIDEDNAIVLKNGSIKVENKWDSGVKPVEYDSILEFKDGNLSILDDKKQTRWSTNTKGAGGEGSKLVMNDDGILTIYTFDNKVIWSSAKVSMKEGLAINVNTKDSEFLPAYETNIATPRSSLQKKTDELVQLKNHNNTDVNSAIFTNILATVLASSMIYYFIIM